MIEHVPSWWPMAGYALGFVMGATAGPRFAFYSKCLRRRRMCPPKGSYGSRLDEGLVQRGNSNGGPTTPKPEIVPGFHGSRRTVRWFINNPVQISECGGPCTVGPSHCDCGALWVDKPTPNQPPTDP